jgi:hypothetical protein
MGAHWRSPLKRNNVSDVEFVAFIKMLLCLDVVLVISAVKIEMGYSKLTVVFITQ